jgi:hypothetical protein
LIRYRRREVPVQEIGGDGVVVVAIRRPLEPLRDGTLPRRPSSRIRRRTLLTDGFAVLQQVFPETRSPITTVTLASTERAQLHPQDEITLAPGPRAGGGAKRRTRFESRADSDTGSSPNAWPSPRR